MPRISACLYLNVTLAKVPYSFLFLPACVDFYKQTLEKFFLFINKHVLLVEQTPTRIARLTECTLSLGSMVVVEGRWGEVVMHEWHLSGWKPLSFSHLPIIIHSEPTFFGLLSLREIFCGSSNSSDCGWADNKRKGKKGSHPTIKLVTYTPLPPFSFCSYSLIHFCAFCNMEDA